MHTSKDQYYLLIKDVMKQEEFEQRIQKRYKEVDELLDKDTIALTILDELGRNKQVITPIKNILPNNEYTISGTVIDKTEPRTFQKKNGTHGKVLHLTLSDTTGFCRVTFWNKDVDVVQDKDIKPGTKIKIINGYTKPDRNGVELNLGRWSMLEVLHNHEEKQPQQIPATNGDLVGELIYKEATHAFFKDDGEFGFVTNIRIKNTDGSELSIVIWGSKVKEIQHIKQGEKIRIKNATLKHINNKKEYHVNGNSSITRG